MVGGRRAEQGIWWPRQFHGDGYDNQSKVMMGMRQMYIIMEMVVKSMGKWEMVYVAHRNYGSAGLTTIITSEDGGISVNSNI